MDRACRTIQRGVARKATERNLRAAGVTKTPARHAAPFTASGEVVHILDPFIAFVKTPQCVTAVVGMAEQFKRSNDESGVAFIQTGELQDKATVVKLRLLRIKYAADQPGYVHFSTISFIGSADFTGPTCHVVNPDKVDFLDGAPHLRFETEALVASVRLWWDALGIHKPPLCTFRSGNVPYPGVNGLPLYVAEGTETSGPAALGGGGGGGSIAEVAVTCPVCSEEWVPSAMRQHIGFRLLHEPERVPATYPCGFCGRESAQFSSDLSQLSGCAVWLSRGQPKMHCKLVGDVKYSIASAAKSSKAAPCTNRPMLCPQCPLKPGVVHWKLNMRKSTGRARTAAALPFQLTLPPSLRQRPRSALGRSL